MGTERIRVKKEEKAARRPGPSYHEFPHQAAPQRRVELSGSPERILQLQRLAGNRFVSQSIETAGSSAALQRKGSGGSFLLDQGTATRIQRARGNGRPLSTPVRESMGTALGYDFSGVRVHTDRDADDLNQKLGARAFTAGRDVYFRNGEYNPETPGGREVLAHELYHVVQQGTGRVRGAGNGMTVRPAGDAFEQEADRVGRSAARGPAPATPHAVAAATASTSRDAGSLQRTSDAPHVLQGKWPWSKKEAAPAKGAKSEPAAAKAAEPVKEAATWKAAQPTKAAEEKAAEKKAPEKKAVPDEGEQKSKWARIGDALVRFNKAIGSLAATAVESALDLLETKVVKTLSEMDVGMQIAGEITGLASVLVSMAEAWAEFKLWKQFKREAAYRKETRESATGPMTQFEAVLRYGENNTFKRFLVVIAVILKGLASFLASVLALVSVGIAAVVKPFISIALTGVQVAYKAGAWIVDKIKKGALKRREKGIVIVDTAFGPEGEDRETATDLILDLKMPVTQGMRELWEADRGSEKPEQAEIGKKMSGGKKTVAVKKLAKMGRDIVFGDYKIGKTVDKQLLAWLEGATVTAAYGGMRGKKAKDELADGVGDKMRGVVW